VTGKAWNEVEHGPKTNKILNKLWEAIGTAEDIKDLAVLANAYGYLLNVHSNYKKTFILEGRIEDLEKLAGLTKKLMPDFKVPNDTVSELRQETK